LRVFHFWPLFGRAFSTPPKNTIRNTGSTSTSGASVLDEIERTIPVWNHENAARAARKVLVEYLGVAAQFVVEDAMDATLAGGDPSRVSEEVQLRSFLIHLAQHLPPNLPIDRIRQAILKECAQPPSSTPPSL
jgi:hypothetical protein